MLVTIPAFTIEYRPAYKVNNTTETVFALLNSASEKGTPIKETKAMFKKFVDHVGQVRINPVELITESIEKYLEIREARYGVTQYDAAWYLSEAKGD